MSYQRVQLVLSLLVFLCCGLVSCTGSGDSKKGNAIEMKVDIKKESPIVEVWTRSGTGDDNVRHQLMLGSLFSFIWMFSKSACADQQKTSDDQTGNPGHQKLSDEKDAKFKMCRSINPFDDTKISEDKKRDTFSVEWLGGKIEGYYYVTKLIQINNKQLPDQKIAIVTNWPLRLSLYNVGKYDGYLGLNYLPMAKTKTKNNQEVSPFFSSLVEQKIIAMKHFGLYYGSPQGELRLGGVNADKIDGGESALKDVPLEENGGRGWLINIDSIKVEGTELGKDLKAYLEIGSPGFFGKKGIIDSINQEIGAREEEFPDSTSENGKVKFTVFPRCAPKDVVLTINGVEYILDKDATMLKSPGYCMTTFEADTETNAYDLTLGTRFFYKYYAVFDVENKKMRFAKVKPSLTAKALNMGSGFIKKFHVPKKPIQ